MRTRLFVLTLILLVKLNANAALISQWNFEGNANDSVGSNNGTFYGGSALVEDSLRGRVAFFNGMTGYIDCGNNSSLDVGGGDFTITAWVKRNSNGGLNDGYFYDIAGKRSPNAPNTGWSFEILSNYDNKWCVKLWTPQEHGTVAFFPFANNAWYHVAVVRSAVNSQITYYVDGINGESARLTVPFSNANLSNSANFSLGRLSGEDYNYFSGWIDDVRIYNNALNPAEIASTVPEPATLVLLGVGGFALRKFKA